jgi:hypothetical protein
MANAGETGMKDRDIVLYVLGRCAKRAEFGRTSLQKVMYFVGRRLDRDLGHHAHYYGPFSPSVERETASLVLSKLVEERIQELGFWTSGGFPAKQYEYNLTSLGTDRLEDVVARHSGDVKRIDEVVNGFLQEAGGLDQRVLSAAAKVDYIAKEERRPVAVQDVRSAAKDLGWTVSPTQVGEVVGLLSHLGFVELQTPAKT